MDKSILRKAISDSAEPTPGYLFRDIANMTFENQATQEKLMAYLMDKLNVKNSVHILAKTLKVIKVLCETGHVDFQKDMQRSSDFLRNFAQYRGVPDAKFGDALNERVRQNAKEAIDAAFSPRKESKVQVHSGHGNTGVAETDKKEGFVTGSSIGGNGTTPGATAHSAPMPTENKWAQAMAAKQGGGAPANDTAASRVKSMVTSGFGMFGKEGVKTDEERMKEGMFSGAGDFKPIEVPLGGDAGFGGPDAAGSASGSKWKFTEDGGNGLPNVQEARMLTPVQREVERICGFKNAPQRVDLSVFLQNLEAAMETAGSWGDAAEALDAKLAQSVPWQQRLNSLCCIEHTIRAKKSEAEFDAYFTENPEDVQRNVHVVQASLKEKALKVLRMLNIPEKSAKPAVAAQPNPTGAATATAGFDGNVVWSQGAQPAPAAEAAPIEDNSAALDFGGLTTTGGGRSRRRGGAGAGGEAAEDKTKLRRRAQMTVASTEEPAQPASTNGDGGWGAPAEGGWGTSAAGTAAGWGETTDNSGFGGGFGGGFGTAGEPVPASSSAPTASAPTGQNDFDAFFGAQGGQQTQQQPVVAPPPAPTNNVVTEDFLASVLPPAKPTTAGAPAPVPPAPSVGPPPPVPPTSAPSTNGGNAQLVQQQQAMLAMLQQQMQTIMSSNADPALKQQQLSALMQQQQQLLQMMQQLQQQQPAGAPPQPSMLPTQQPSYGGPARQEPAGAGQFQALGQEMKRSMGM